MYYLHTQQKVYFCLFTLKINPEPIPCHLRNIIKLNLRVSQLNLPISIYRKCVCVKREIRRQNTKSRAPRNTQEQYGSKAHYCLTSINVILIEIVTELEVPYTTRSREFGYMKRG